MQIEEALTNWGLNEKEVKVYLATLKLGQSRVNEIAKKAGILRETTYFILNSLSEKGLVSHVIKSKVKYFEASPPSRFKSILREKEKEIDGVLLELNTLKNLRVEKPQVKLYEGKGGLKSILDDIIETKKPIFAYANAEIFKTLDIAFPQFVKRRVEHQISAKIIQEKTDSTLDAKKIDPEQYRKIRFFPERLKSNVFIYGNKVAFINASKKELVGIIVEDKEISETQKQVFDFMWEASK